MAYLSRNLNAENVFFVKLNSIIPPSQYVSWFQPRTPFATARTVSAASAEAANTSTALVPVDKGAETLWSHSFIAHIVLCIPPSKVQEERELEKNDRRIDKLCDCRYIYMFPFFVIPFVAFPILSCSLTVYSSISQIPETIAGASPPPSPCCGPCLHFYRESNAVFELLVDAHRIVQTYATSTAVLNSKCCLRDLPTHTAASNVSPVICTARVELRPFVYIIYEERHNCVHHGYTHETDAATSHSPMRSYGFRLQVVYSPPYARVFVSSGRCSSLTMPRFLTEEPYLSPTRSTFT